MVVGVLIVSALLCQLGVALDNGLALTPPMGWLSWERFRCNVDCKNDPENCISEQLYKRQADLMVSEGYKDAGYEYVNIDDCWPAEERDRQGRLVADPDRFPSGIKELSRYMHSKGLKLGIFADFGTRMFEDIYPGSEFYMSTDANTFAEWEVDSLKFDGWASNPEDMTIGYPAMGQFLNLTNRPILYSCLWPFIQDKKGYPVSSYKDIAKACNTWRNHQDVQDSWDSIMGIIDFYGKDEGNFSAVAGPGAFNDPDMLIVGDFGLSDYQQKAQFGMWALLAAPLMMSNDLATISNTAKNLLLNRNIIAINQDPLGAQATRILKDPGKISVWVKKLAKPGSYAIGFLNASDQGKPAHYKTTFADLGFTNENGFSVREVFENKTMGNFGLTDKFEIDVNPTSISIIIADPQ